MYQYNSSERESKRPIIATMALSEAKGSILVSFLLCMLNAGLPYLIASAQESLFDSLLFSQQPNRVILTIAQLLLLYSLAKYLYSYGLTIILNLIDNSATKKLEFCVQKKVNEKYIKLAFENTVEKSVVDAKKNADESAACAWTVWRNGFEVTSTILGVIVSLFYLRPLGSQYFVIFLILLIPVFCFSIFAGSHYYDTWSKLALTRRRAKYYFDVLTEKSTAYERIFFRYKPFFLTKYVKEYANVRSTSIREEFNGAKLVLTSTLSLCIYIGIVLGMAIRQRILGLVTISYVTSLATLMPTLLISSVKKASTYSNEFFKSLKQCSAIGTIFDYEEEFHDIAYMQRPAPKMVELEFRNVSFCYPQSNETVIENLSFKCYAGKHYAFVGCNGVGKSTIVKLILRLYSVTAGEIWINGKNINHMTREELNSYVCVLFQDYTKYFTTIRDNIGIGRLDALQNTECLKQMSEISGASEFIDKLPLGWDSKLGKQRAGGINLSGGEWQKLAFSRLLMSKCPLKILDEPTAAMDPEAEYELYQQYAKVMQGVTTIFISHRLASTALADEIFVFGQKTIIERGSHEELMKKKGTYFEMFSQQSQTYFGN